MINKVPKAVIDKVVYSNGLYELTEGGKLGLNFHQGQLTTWQSRRRFILMLAGTQGGKTSFGPWWLWREIQLRGEGDYLAVTTNFDMFRLKMLPEMRKVFENILRIGRYWPGARILELRDPISGKFHANRVDDPMWGRIVLRSIQAPAGLESATAKAAWLDEVGQDDWDITHWEALRRRLSLNQGRILGTSTIYNSGWVKTEWHDRWMNGDPDYDIIKFASFANPKFPRTEYEHARATMPEWRFKMFYDAEFSRPPGLIYGDFTEDMVVKQGDLPKFQPYQRRIVGIDFGGANTAALVLVEDTTTSPSTWYVVEESLFGHLSTKEHVTMVYDLISPVREASFVGGSPGETQYRMDWAREGMDVQQPSVSEVELGISAVIRLIKENRLRISDKCVGLRHEMATYRRRTESDGQTSEVIDNKGRFHRVDALRYAISQIHSSVEEAWVV